MIRDFIRELDLDQIEEHKVLISALLDRIFEIMVYKKNKINSDLLVKIVNDFLSKGSQFCVD